MSKDAYVEYLAHRALYDEYARPGVGCHPSMKSLLYQRGWADPMTGRLTDVGRRHMAYLINQHIVTGAPIPGDPYESS